jgi:hypothetical protein
MVRDPTPEIKIENPMNRTKRLAGKIGLVLCGALLNLECTTYGQPSVSVGVSVPLPAVEIRAESDFYEPLAPHGEWVVVGSYGRCWRPARVEAGWRPYCNGYWQRSEAGWYWVSDEPWAWATYHYGRWDYTDQYGWYWVPQTQWAPAWVSWHSGGGYVGWAPLLPSVRISASGFVGFNVSLISPRAFVFVEQRRFLDPIRPTTVVVNNTTIINKTVNITNTKIVNNTVINEGPATTVIEKASGRKVQAIQVRELRRKEEAPVVARQRTVAANSDKQVPAAVRSAVEPIEKKAQAAPGRGAKDSEEKIKTEPGESQKKAPAEPEPRTNPSEKRAPAEPEHPGKDKKGDVQKGAKDAKDKSHGDKPEQTPPQKPSVTPPPSND